MTAAGSAEVAYRVESDFQTAGTTGWRQPGVNITVGDLSVDNNAQRNRQPDSPLSGGSTAGNFTGTATVDFDLTGDNVFGDLVPGFADAGSLSDAGLQAPTAEWYFAVDSLDNSLAQFESEIVFNGVAVTSAEIDYTEGEPISVSLSLEASGLSSNAPTAISGPTVDQVFTHHGTSATIGGLGQSGLQSATLSLDGLARRQEQQERGPRVMVVDEMEPELTTDAVFSEVDQLDLALNGGTSGSVLQQLQAASSGGLTFENGNGSVVQFELIDPTPNNYAWNDLVAPDTDLTEEVTYQLHDVTLV
jgi:hypothetical protein